MGSDSTASAPPCVIINLSAGFHLLEAIGAMPFEAHGPVGAHGLVGDPSADPSLFRGESDSAQP